MTAPPNYRSNQINAGLLFVQTKQSLVEAEQNVETYRDWTTLFDGDFGSIAADTEVDFRLSWADENSTGRNQTVVALYTGDAGAFRISKYTGNSLAVGQGDLNAQTVLTAVVLTPEISVFVPSFTIEALAEDDGVLKTGTLTFSKSLTIDGMTFVLGETIGTIELSKTYNAP